LSKKIPISSEKAVVKGAFGIDRTKNTAIPPRLGVGKPAIVRYTALRKRFRKTAFLATDLGATAAALNMPGFAKNFAEIRLF
jgi:hypothetical protein